MFFGVSILFDLIFALIVFGFIATFFRNFQRISRFQNNIFDATEHLARKNRERDRIPDGPRDYECDQCGAALDDDADVSPSGDFKCTYCGKWSNIHV